MERKPDIIIGSPEVSRYVDPEVDQAEYRQFLKDSKAAALAGYPPELYAGKPVEGEVLDEKKEGWEC